MTPAHDSFKIVLEKFSGQDGFEFSMKTKELKPQLKEEQASADLFSMFYAAAGLVTKALDTSADLGYDSYQLLKMFQTAIEEDFFANIDNKEINDLTDQGSREP